MKHILTAGGKRQVSPAILVDAPSTGGILTCRIVRGAPLAGVRLSPALSFNAPPHLVRFLDIYLHLVPNADKYTPFFANTTLFRTGRENVAVEFGHDDSKTAYFTVRIGNNGKKGPGGLVARLDPEQRTEGQCLQLACCCLISVLYLRRHAHE